VALLPKRPHLALRAGRARAGETFEARLIVNAERKVSINSFDFELRGQERAHGAPITHSLRTLCALKEIVTDFRAVPPGRTVVGLAFDLPHDLPPSYQGRLFQVDYQLSARADIPWWPDAVADWSIDVDCVRDEAPGAVLEDGVALPGGSTLDVQLDSGRVVIGGRLRGRASALSPAPLTHHIELTLVAFEDLAFAPGAPVEAWRFPVGRVAPRSSIDFDVAVPSTVTASFTARLGSLSWQLEAALRTAHGLAVVRLPVRPTREHDGGRAVPLPKVSVLLDIDEVWRTTAERFGLTYQGGHMNGEFGACQVELARRVRGAQRSVHASMRFPSLRLGFSAEPRRIEGTPVRRGVRVGDGNDPLYLLTSREPHQLVALLGGLSELLARLPRTSMSDDRLDVTAFESGRNLDQMQGLVETLRALADKLALVRVALPPPAASTELPAWEALAASLQGELRRGDLSITGRLRGVRVDVQPRWPPYAALTLRVGLAHALPPELRDKELTREALPSRAAAALAIASRGKPCQLSANQTTLTLTVPYLTPTPEGLEARLAAMCDVSAQLVGGGSPYR